MLVCDLFADNLSSNIRGQDILKFIRMSALRTQNACIKSRISAKQRLNNRQMRFIARRSLDSIQPFTLNYLNLMIHFPTNASGTEMRICKLTLGSGMRIRITFYVIYVFGFVGENVNNHEFEIHFVHKSCALTNPKNSALV